MFYRLSAEQQNELRRLPETGMGYQLIEARFSGEFASKEFLVLNGKLAIEEDFLIKTYLKQIFSQGFNLFFKNASVREFRSIKLNDTHRPNQLREIGNFSSAAAKDNAIQYPDGKSYYVRLSAFEDDIRVDKKNNCLVQGSYTTTKNDYEVCVNTKDDPVERYALPNDEIISWAFHLKPETEDGYKYGTVQPEFGKRGGGKECFFENGTSFGTFKMQTAYGVFYP